MDFSAAIGSVVPGTFVPDLGKNDETPNVSGIPGVAAPGTDTSGATSFKDTVKEMLAGVNDKINTSDQNSRDLATGVTTDINKVVVSVEEANLELQYTMAVRQKLLDAYTQISALQV